MGLEASIAATFKGQTARGTARLETATLEFRSEAFKLSVPLRDIERVAARDGRLAIVSPHGTISLALGPAAEKWAAKIQNPPSRLDKIGVKPGWAVSVIGQVDQDFLDELARVARELSIGRARKHSDAIFFSATREADLRRLSAFKSSIQPAGAIWVIRPKGRPEISERAVLTAGKAAGLVDVKVVGFSATHTAGKFVIPVRDRPTTRVAASRGRTDRRTDLPPGGSEVNRKPSRS